MKDSSELPAASAVVPLLVLPSDVALVHDWLTGYAGGERVLEQMIALHPGATVYTSIDTLKPGERGFLQGKSPVTSFAQGLPGIGRYYRHLLPLLMLGIEQLDVSRHPLVLSSSSAIAKGVLTGPDQLHIAYVHSPMRYAWDQQHEYLRATGLDRGFKGLLARRLLQRARLWDLRTANGVDLFVANSRFIARRIWKAYRRRATVVYPPVDVQSFRPWARKDSFYLTASRLVPYKRVPAIVEAFRHLPERRLIVIGDGGGMGRVKALAGPNVEVLGHQPPEALREYMQKARAFLIAAEEDFGISVVEAQACGTPVIAYGRGGALESVRGAEAARPTGMFFEDPSAECIAAAIRRFDAIAESISPADCRANAERFSTDVFRTRFAALVSTAWARFQRRMARSRTA